MNILNHQKLFIKNGPHKNATAVDTCLRLSLHVIDMQLLCIAVSLLQLSMTMLGLPP